MELTSPDAENPNKLVDPSVDSFLLSFDYRVEAPDGEKLAAGDTFQFKINGWDQLGIVVDTPPIDIMDGPVKIGEATIAADGTVTLTFNENVNNDEFVGGSVWVQIDQEWAQDLVQNDDVRLDFSVDTKTGTTETHFIIPGDPEVPPPGPGTVPTKSGSFTREDEGRTNPDNAIVWDIKAPAGGPTEKVVITDTVPGYADGTNTWVFDCAEAIEYYGGDSTPIDVQCSEGELTITFDAYDGANPPGIRIKADIVGTANNSDNPNAERLTFDNDITSTTYGEDDEPLNPDGTGATASLPQREIGNGNDPLKTGEWLDANQARDRVGDEEAPGAIAWNIRVPSGPTDGVTLTDTAPAGTRFDCATGETGLIQTNGLDAPVSISCTPEEITIVMGPYDTFEPSKLAVFRVEATIETPQPENPRQPIDPITNTVTSEFIPDGGGTPYTGSSDATLTQTMPPVPATQASKTGKFTRRYRGEYNKEDAIEWTITLPAGPNHGVEITDVAPVNAGVPVWEFSCPVVIDPASYTPWAVGDPNAPVMTVPSDPVITCANGEVTVEFPNGYKSGSPTITFLVDIKVDFAVDQQLTNIATVRVKDYLTDPEFSEDGWTTTEAKDTQTQKRFQGGTGTRGRRGEFKVSIGDYVWFDQDRDGKQDVGEPPVPGTVVKLFEKAEDGTWIDTGRTTTTNANGYYEFLNLDSDWEYKLELVHPERFADGQLIGGWTTKGGGDENDNRPSAWIGDDSNVDPTTNSIIFTSPSVGGNKSGPGNTDNPTLDGGLILPFVSVGDYVWFDHDRDGQQGGENDTPLQGITVNLYLKEGTTPVKTTTTNAQGYYYFQSLEPSTEYFIEFVLPAWADEFTEHGTTPGSTTDVEASGTDSDANVTTGRTPVFTTDENGQNLATPGAADHPTIDAGIVSKHVSVGDYVWYDTNKNGVQDAGEQPVSGLTVNLIKDGAVVGTTTTNNSGYYFFRNLDTESLYQIEFVLPAGGNYEWTQKDAGGNDATDSDVDPITNRTDVFRTDKYGYNRPWLNGQSGYTSYVKDMADNPTLDAGLIRYVSIGDRVWFDANRDGLQDANTTVEYGVPDVTVTLLQSNGAGGWIPAIDRDGNVIPAITTDENGNYSFVDLVAGNQYRLEFEEPTHLPDTDGRPLEGWTKVVGGWNDASNSDVTDQDGVGVVEFTAPATGMNNPHGEGTNPDNPRLDAGVVLPMVSVGDYVWFDWNKDGIQNTSTDPREWPVANVPVRLIAADGVTVLKSTTTDANGFYSFTDLEPGTTYIIEFDVPDNYDGWTGKTTNGPTQVNNSKVNPDTNRTDPFTTPTDPAVLTNSATTPDVPTLDAGLIVSKVSVGDYVWFDTNLNGLQDEGEEPFAGVTVNLLDADGTTVLDSTTTDANGFYFFTDLDTATGYILEFEKPTGYAWTIQNAGGDTADLDGNNDSDINPANGRVSFRSEANGANLPWPDQTYDGADIRADNPTLDAGLVKLVSVGDKVWFDYDKDGVQGTDPLEEPVPGVKVTLVRVDGSEPNRETTTDANGYYGFDNLYPGEDYKLVFEKPANFDDWTEQNAAAGTDATDSDVDAAGEITFTAPTRQDGQNVITPENADDPTLDAGLIINKVSIGDYVWWDQNLNGLQDEDTPIAGVTVTISGPDGFNVTTTTDANGFYFFTDLTPSAEYTLDFTLPTDAEWAWTKQDQGADDALDSDVDANGQVTFNAPLLGANRPWPNGEDEFSYVKDMADDPTLDAGIVKLVSVGDYLWFDFNRNGTQDEGPEFGIDGVTVTLNDESGNFICSTTTADGGYYGFQNLYPGNVYQIVFDFPDGYDGWTTQHVDSGDPAQYGRDDSDVDENGFTSFVAPTADQHLMKNEIGGKDVADDPTHDAGVIIDKVSMGDYVWIDYNRDGVQGDPADEPAIAGVTVSLYKIVDGAQVFVESTTTDANGGYSFIDLDPASQYQVRFELPDGGFTIDGETYTSWTWTKNEGGVDLPLNSDAGTDGWTAVFTTPEFGYNEPHTSERGADFPFVDAGIHPTVAVGDRVWVDYNNDGLQGDHAVEPGIGGVTVEIYAIVDGTPTLVDSTVTAADGTYVFTDLLPETEYQVRFTIPTTGLTVDGETYLGWTWTKQTGEILDADNSDAGTDGWTSTFTTPKHGNNESAYDSADVPEIDAGVVPQVSVGDYVWYDANRDGIQDADEIPVPNVTVTITSPDGFTATTETDENGYYYFQNLLPEVEYTITFEKPDGYTEWTMQGAGDDESIDSNVDPSGVTTVITPKHGDNLAEPDKADDPTIDAGLVIKVSVGDYVWDDEDRDGIQDPTEPGVEGVIVIIYGPDGEEVARTTTDPDGYYAFPDLFPDTEYVIEFEKPDGYADWTTPNEGDDDGDDSDVDPTNGRVTITTPETGSNKTEPGEADDPTIDAGLVRLISVGDYVWYDADRDGIQDASETPIPGVKVTITGPNGFTATTTTDSNGYYAFADLYPETEYTITFEKPENYTEWTIQGAGEDDAIDSNVDPAGTFTFTTPKHGNNLGGPDNTDDPTIDAGLVIKVSVGDYVWDDENKNGIQDPTEKPAEGIKVHIYQGEKIVGTTTTDKDGYYYFQDLFPNTDYIIVFEKPAGYEWTSQFSGGDTGVDSDVDVFGIIRFTTPSTGMNLIGPDMADNPTLDAGLAVKPAPEPTVPPVTELPSTGTGTPNGMMSMLLASMAGLMLAAVALRMNASKRS